MKRLLIIFILVAFNIATFAQSQKTTKEQAIEIAKTLTAKQDVNVYVSKQTITGKTEISTMYKSFVTPDYESYLIFIDEHPYQSWWHDCKYVFVNIITGKYKTVNMKYPPDMELIDVVKEKKITKKGKLFHFDKKTKNFTTTDNEWAVIISGGYNMDNNHERYWNDCSAIYSALINIYGYQDDHIFVLMSDGTNSANDRHLINGNYNSSPLDLDDDGDNDIQFAATQTNITDVFNTLSELLDANDNLFIYTTDHGGQESGQDAFIYLWKQTMRDDQFATEVNKINAQRINIVMEQCHSGGFIDDLQANNRVIATACRYDEPSYSTSNLMYDEFVFHWTAGIAGETPDGNDIDADTNNDDFVSMLEAFNYAKNHDTKTEHPQYSSMPTTTGQYLSLLGTIPFVIGTNIVCTSNSTFTLQNRPPNSTGTWTRSNNLIYVSGQGTNNYTVKANGSGNGWVQVNINGAIFRKTFWVGLKTSIVGNNYVSYLCSGNWYANSSCANNYDWYLKKEGWGGYVSIQNSSSNQLTLNSVISKSKKPVPLPGEETIFHLFVRASNGSGNYCQSTLKRIVAKGNVDLVVGNGGGLPPFELKISPNPANNIITVNIDNQAEKTNPNIEYIVRLLDKYQKTIYQRNIKNSQTTPKNIKVL